MVSAPITRPIEAQEPAQEHTVKKALDKAHYRAAYFVHALHVRQPEGEVPYIAERHEQDKDQEKRHDHKPHTGKGIAQDGDDRLGHSDPVGIGKAHSVARKLLRALFIKPHRGEALIGIVIAQRGILREDILKRKVAAAVAHSIKNGIAVLGGVHIAVTKGSTAGTISCEYAEARRLPPKSAMIIASIPAMPPTSPFL